MAVTRPDGTLQLEFGDLKLKLPPEPAYSLTPPRTREPAGGVRLLSWYLEWPSLGNPALGRPAPRHPSEVIARLVNLLMMSARCRVAGSGVSDECEVPGRGFGG
jgi:hypothetical protein